MKTFIWTACIFLLDIFWFVKIIVDAPMEAIKAKLTPIKFKFWNEGPNTKNNPINEIKKTTLIFELIFSLSKKIDAIKTIIG